VLVLVLVLAGTHRRTSAALSPKAQLLPTHPCLHETRPD
jgi:hypothetical protein